jgi:hypothetical protein
MSVPIQFEATLDGSNRKKDKSISVRLTSNFEMTTDDYSQIDRLLGSAGWLLFSPNEVQESDIPQEPAATQEGKSKAQRLRAVNFLIWQQSKIDEPFEVWYDRMFERIMDKLKEKLD